MRNKYNEIIELEVLNGIDRAFHSLIVETNNNMVTYPANTYGLCEKLADELKNELPKYVDKVFETIKSRLSK